MGISNDRLKEARINAGFKSARSAALRYGWNPSTYASHENGQTQVPVAAAEEYAPRFGVSAGWILTGETPPPDYNPSDADLIAALRQAPAAKKAAVAVLLGVPPPPIESPKPPASSPAKRSAKLR
jgi:hypothetical protein